jgi:hypothetical protein
MKRGGSWSCTECTASRRGVGVGVVDVVAVVVLSVRPLVGLQAGRQAGGQELAGLQAGLGGKNG